MHYRCQSNQTQETLEHADTDIKHTAWRLKSLILWTELLHQDFYRLDFLFPSWERNIDGTCWGSVQKSELYLSLQWSFLQRNGPDIPEEQGSAILNNCVSGTTEKELGKGNCLDNSSTCNQNGQSKNICAFVEWSSSLQFWVTRYIDIHERGLKEDIFWGKSLHGCPGGKFFNLLDPPEMAFLGDGGLGFECCMGWSWHGSPLLVDVLPK